MSNTNNTPDGLLSILKYENDKTAFMAVHDRLISSGYKMQAKQNKSGFDVKYSIKSRKPIVQMLYGKNKNSGFEIHMRLLHVAQYSKRFSELSAHIRDCCLQGGDCRNCGYCDKAYVFEFEGITYTKCQFICANFCFTGIDVDDVDSIIRVLDMELRSMSGFP